MGVGFDHIWLTVAFQHEQPHNYHHVLNKILVSSDSYMDVCDPDSVSYKPNQFEPVRQAHTAMMACLQYVYKLQYI